MSIPTVIRLIQRVCTERLAQNPTLGHSVFPHVSSSLYLVITLTILGALFDCLHLSSVNWCFQSCRILWESPKISENEAAMLPAIT